MSINTEVYTVSDIMVILDLSKNTAYDLIKEGHFPIIKIKSTYRIPRKGFNEWLNKNQ
jgi:excisionase family DNA binding protein